MSREAHSAGEVFRNERIKLTVADAVWRKNLGLRRIKQQGNRREGLQLLGVSVMYYFRAAVLKVRK